MYVWWSKLQIRESGINENHMVAYSNWLPSVPVLSRRGDVSALIQLQPVPINRHITTSLPIYIYIHVNTYTVIMICVHHTLSLSSKQAAEELLWIANRLSAVWLGCRRLTILTVHISSNQQRSVI